MQSEPTEISTLFTDTTIVSTLVASQHGGHDLDLNSASSVDELQEVNDRERASSSTITREGLRKLSLSERRYTAKPSAARISEYENAFLPTPAKVEYEGPGFKVIKGKGHRLDGPRLDEFPNEVLTHILSHLPATSLSAVSLVSRRFYSLVTTPHAWRIAFSRYFPGQDAIDLSTTRDNRRNSDQEVRETLRAEQRFFTRLTALSSWRSEYILRTLLLRSLSRGKPAQIVPGHGASSRSNSAANNANAAVTYNSQLFATINHIHATWSNGKKSPRFIHGTDETGTSCTSDPNIGKVDAWGLTDPQSLPQFADLFPGDTAYGLGEGAAIGSPNVMDVSQPYGMVYGEGFPGGLVYYRSPEEMRGRFLAVSEPYSEYELGIPKVINLAESICSVWVAKSPAVPTVTDGLVGILAGSSCGVVTSYSLGADNLRDCRLNKGEITARWMLSPGVPIIAIAVDESYHANRKAAGRIWAVALNALGEVYYLSEVPQRAHVERGAKLNERALARLAWETGRSVYWNFTEPSRRAARDDVYHEFEYDGSYSPRSSCKSMNLSKEQIIAETREIEKFLAFPPKHFRKICEGWDMRRKLEVDFGGDDGHGAGENIVVICCGVENGEGAQLKRYTRVNAEQASFDDYPAPKSPALVAVSAPMSSLFGGGVPKVTPRSAPKGTVTPEQRAASGIFAEEWRTSLLMFPSKAVEITVSAIDKSTFALLTATEDPLLTIGGKSLESSPFATPAEGPMKSPSDVPGYRARYLAVGTKTGTIMIWDMRGPQSSNSTLVNELQPLRIIITDSPQVSCLALSALFLVHGGNDGLVQAWDPLASTLQPLRTLNSRFSSRARRRLVQAEASIQGVGINLYAAGALEIDPDPTVLRGMVSLGTHLRYWSYSSNGADQISSKKRRLRRSSERGNNSTQDRFSNTGRGALMDYIATEQEELSKDKERRAREDARLRGRFGVDFADMTEEEALRYAELLSQEEFEKDEQRKVGDIPLNSHGSSTQSAWSSVTATPEGSVAGHSTSPRAKNDDELNHEIEEAIRLSLLDGESDMSSSPQASGSGGYEIPITYKQKKSKRSPVSSPSMGHFDASNNREVAADDLEFALQLSLAEEESRRMEALQGEDFPTLEVVGVEGKGKGRA